MNTRTLDRNRMTLAALAVSLLASACSSVPKPAEPDGSSRVAVNSQARLVQLQERVSMDRAILTENNQLKAQVGELRAQLGEMREIVRGALALPPVPVPVHAVPPATQPQTVQPAPQVPAAKVSATTSNALPAQAFEVTASGAVIRVFHEFAKTDFRPTAETAKALRNALPAADSISVRGHTDSSTPNPVDRLIAIERAVKARSWLLANGAEPGSVRLHFRSAGSFIADNETAQGRALNRRVEVRLQGAGVGAAVSKVLQDGRA